MSREACHTLSAVSRVRTKLAVIVLWSDVEMLGDCPPPVVKQLCGLLPWRHAVRVCLRPPAVACGLCCWAVWTLLAIILWWDMLRCYLHHAECGLGQQHPCNGSFFCTCCDSMLSHLSDMVCAAAVALAALHA
jgi:hypothetical protein